MEDSFLKSYLIEQLTTAKKQLQTIGPEADIEALHRFRVALRRFRAVLSAFTKNCYAPDAVVKSMVKVTNPLRETDVFLASIDKERYPQLHRSVGAYREKEYKKTWKPKTAERFGHTLDALIADLSSLKINPGKKRLVHTGRALYTAAQKARKELTKDSKESEFHETRLRFKQARYALEFLEETGLMEAGNKISKTKKAQDHFGAIQDAANQLEWLHRFCQNTPSDECSALYHERKNALKHLKKTFEI